MREAGLDQIAVAASQLDGAEPRVDEPAPLELPSDARDALGAALLLSFATAIPQRVQLAVPLMLVAFVVAWRATRAPRPSRIGWGGAYAALAAMATMPLFLPLPTPSLPAFVWGARLFPWLAVPLVGLHAAANDRWRPRVLWALVIPALSLQLLVVHDFAHPVIDVWSWTQFEAQTVLAGVHPYTVVAPDVYQGGFHYGYTTAIYQYLPADILFAIPGYALGGDYRYSLVACNVATILLARAAGRRLGAAPRLVDVVTLALALHPRGAWMIAHGWTEPFLCVCLAAFVYAEARAPGGPLSSVAFLMLPALKQYFFAPTLIYLATRPRLRSLAVGMAVAALTVVPFLAWNARATLDGILWVVKTPPFRDDSLSLSALVAAVTGWRWGKLPGMLSQLIAGGVAFALLRQRGVGGLLLASALALFASFLTAPQAFLNYYFFVSTLLLAASLVLARRCE